MSTYYSFACKKCKLQGGFYSRQAWGTGNADLIDTFKFTMYHALNCGTDQIIMLSEHDEESEWSDTNIGGYVRLKHLKDTADIMPSSNDWVFIEEHNGMAWEDVKKEWVNNEIKKIGKE